MEFSKIIVLLAFIISPVIVLIMMIGNFILLWVGKESMAQETIATITTYGGITSSLSFAAYGTVNAVRTWSLNKHCNGIIGGGENGNRLETEVKQSEVLGSGSGMGHISSGGYQYGGK